MSSVPTVTLSLWRYDAIVLFDWLQEVDFDQLPIRHPAEKQALTDLLTRMEADTDLTHTVTQDSVDAARSEVARHMGW